MTITLDMPMGDYLASKRISHSKLRTYDQKGPRGYYICVEQKRHDEEDTKAFLAGRAIEDALQRPAEFRSRYVAKPEGLSFSSKEGRVWRAFVTGTVGGLGKDDAQLSMAVLAQRGGGFAQRFAVKPEGMSFAKADGKAWQQAQLAAGLEILSADDARIAERLADLLRDCPSTPREVLDPEDARAAEALLGTLESCPVARALIDACSVQPTIHHDESAWNVPGLQSRPDWMCLEGCAASEWRPYVLDLKTTSTLQQLGTGRSIVKYGYHRQAAMVRMVLGLEGVDMRGFRYLLLGAEKAFPFRWRVFEVPTALIDHGQDWCVQRLEALGEHYSTGEWPLVPSEITTCDVPQWLDESEAA